MNTNEVLAEYAVGILQYKELTLSMLRIKRPVIDHFLTEFQALEDSQGEQSLAILKEHCAAGDASFAYYDNAAQSLVGQIGAFGPRAGESGRIALQPVYLIVHPAYAGKDLSRAILYTAIEYNLTQFPHVSTVHYIPQPTAIATVAKRLRELDPDLLAFGRADNRAFNLHAENIRASLPCVKKKYGLDLRPHS